jgi:hypothetical protein
MDSPYSAPRVQDDASPVDGKARKALQVARFLALCSMAFSWVIYYLVGELRFIAGGVTFKAWTEPWVQVLVWKSGLLPCAAVVGTAILTLVLSCTGRKQPTLGLALASMGLAFLTLVGLFAVFRSLIPA